MNNTQCAIELAIKEGWKPFDKFKKKFEMEENYAIFYDSVNVRRYALDTMFLDPLFWQSLGKARGTDGDLVGWHHGMNIEEWKYWWHSFLDTLAEGKTAEDFFKQLLANK